MEELRAEKDAQIQRLTTQLATADTALRESQSRADALADKYTQLATQKAEPPKLPERTQDEVVRAILDRAGHNGRLRTHLSKWAAAERRKHELTDEQIITRILYWAPTDDDAGIDMT